LVVRAVEEAGFAGTWGAYGRAWAEGGVMINMGIRIEYQNRFRRLVLRQNAVVNDAIGRVDAGRWSADEEKRLSVIFSRLDGNLASILRSLVADCDVDPLDAIEKALEAMAEEISRAEALVYGAPPAGARGGRSGYDG
jgi:hypothetical protein